jgi:hypothetical protein
VQSQHGPTRMDHEPPVKAVAGGAARNPCAPLQGSHFAEGCVGGDI